MSQGQGSISFSEPPGAGGGGGAVAGARNGLSLDGINDAVLGNDTTDATDPAKLISNRRIQCEDFIIEFAMNGDMATLFGINSQNGGPPNTLQGIWIRPSSGFWECWQPGNYGVDYTPNGKAGRWTSGSAIFNGVNPDGRPNVVGTWWSYNEDFQASRIDPTEAAFRFATETYFQIGGGDPYFEFHIPEITTTGGTTYRLDSLYADRLTGDAFRERVQSSEQWFSTDFGVGTGLPWLNAQYGTATISFELHQNTSAATTQVRLLNNPDATEGRIELGSSGPGSGVLFINTSVGVPMEFNMDRLAAIPRGGGYISLGIQTVVTTASFATPAYGSTVLECQSITAGFLAPQMTTAQRLAIAAPPEGLMVVDLSVPGLFVFNSGVWKQATLV